MHRSAKYIIAALALIFLKALSGFPTQSWNPGFSESRAIAEPIGMPEREPAAPPMGIAETVSADPELARLLEIALPDGAPAVPTP